MAVRLYRKLAVAYIQASRDHEVCRLGYQQTQLRISCFQPEPVVAYAGPEHCPGRSGHVPDVPDVCSRQHPDHQWPCFCTLVFQFGSCA